MYFTLHMKDNHSQEITEYEWTAKVFRVRMVVVRVFSWVEKDFKSIFLFKWKNDSFYVFVVFEWCLSNRYNSPMVQTPTFSECKEYLIQMSFKKFV